MDHTRISDALVKVASQIWHWCPACEEIHQYAIDKPFTNGAKWSFDGNAAKPSFTPSMNIRIGPYSEGKNGVCHYFITNGLISYLPDCTHALAGHVVDLPPLPAKYWRLWK